MPNGRDERVAVSYISIHRESDPPVFLPPPLGGIPLNRWSLIDRPTKNLRVAYCPGQAEPWIIVPIVVFQRWNMAYLLSISVIMTNDSPETSN